MDFSNWESVEKEFPLNQQLKIDEILSKEYMYPPRPIPIGRTDIYIIPSKYWPIINDPKYINMAQKQSCISEYFAVTLYISYTKESNVVFYSAGQEQIIEKKIEKTSVVKEATSFSTSLRTLIKTDLEMKYKELSINFSAEIEGKISYSKTKEDTWSKDTTITEKITIPAADYERALVPWVLSKVMIVYRKHKKNGNQIAIISEEQEHIFPKLYKV